MKTLNILLNNLIIFNLYRLKPLLICKTDCNFDELTNGKTAAQIFTLAKELVPYLSPEVKNIKKKKQEKEKDFSFYLLFLVITFV